MSISKVKYLGESFILILYRSVINSSVFFSHLINPQFFEGFFIFIYMENDLRLKITEYFNLSPSDRKKLIVDLVDFYFEKNVSTRTKNEFEVSIGQLLFNLELEYRFALKSESYNRAEIYSKLTTIFNNIRNQYLNENEL